MVYYYIIQNTIMFNNIIPLLYGIYTNGILLLWFMVYNVQLIGFFRLTRSIIADQLRMPT